MARLMMIAIGAVAAMAWAAGAQAATSRAGAISKFDGVDEIVEACTNSTTFVNMPGMSRTFTQGGTGSDEVVVQFQAAASMFGSEPFDTGFVRLQVGSTEQTPGTVPFIAVNSQGARGFTWQTAPVAAGSRTIRVQWRTDLGSSFCVDARSLVILHK